MSKQINGELPFNYNLVTIFNPITDSDIEMEAEDDSVMITEDDEIMVTEDSA